MMRILWIRIRIRNTSPKAKSESALTTKIYKPYNKYFFKNIFYNFFAIFLSEVSVRISMNSDPDVAK